MHRHCQGRCPDTGSLTLPQPGFGLADDYVAWLKSFSSDPEVVIVEILLIFALFHSGLAGLRCASSR